MQGRAPWAPTLWSMNTISAEQNTMKDQENSTHATQVTNQLKEFLNHFPPESKEKAFEQIYEILQVLDAYLRDNLQQHIHCMSPDSEYVSLIMYAITIEIDLCNFLAIWAVLSILLDTQSNTLQYVKSL